MMLLWTDSSLGLSHSTVMQVSMSWSITVETLVPRPVAALSGHKVQAVVCGYHHTLIATEGEVFSCGTGEHGQLGLHGVTVAATAVPIPTLKGVGVVSVACSRYHCTALSEGGRVWSWGRGEYGQLGHGDQENRETPGLVKALGETVRSIGCGWGHSMVITKAGEVLTWGFGGKGQLGHGDTLRHLIPKKVEGITGAELMACGYYHNIVSTKQNDTYTWGKSDRGQLGHGDTLTVLTPRAVESLCGDSVIYLDCGDYNSAVATASGSVFLWGRGQEGQLGSESLDDVLAPQCYEAFQGAGLASLSLGWGHGAVVTTDALAVRKPAEPLPVTATATDEASASDTPTENATTVERKEDVEPSLKEHYRPTAATGGVGAGLQEGLPVMPSSVSLKANGRAALSDFSQDYRDMLQYEEMTEEHLAKIDQVSLTTLINNPDCSPTLIATSLTLTLIRW